jgi:hypothetical protein
MFEITPTPSSGIISVSAPHCSHQARTEVRPRKISRDSVSIVIFVCFVMSLALAWHELTGRRYRA